MPNEIKYTITAHLATLSTNSRTSWTKELNLVSWNDKEPKYDLREWSPDHSKKGKGVTLSREEFGSFSSWLWSYSGNKTILYIGHEKGNFPVSNGLSDEIAKELKKRGFKYLGTITVYSHLQACGIINDHGKDCPCYQHIVENYPTVRKRRYLEK